MWSRALRLQALEEAAARASHRGRACAAWGRARTRARSTWATDLRCAFKVESHNHPSAVEPFQGAATGVGGILRDVFAVGARPIAVLDSLRFGELDSDRSRYLFDWAVEGIGHYGNSIGVPTVGGEVYFEGAYEQNCLVNAMCVGPRTPRAADPQRRRRAGNLRRAHGRARPAATASAAPPCWRAPSCRDEDASKRPTRADRRPVRGEEADRVLPRAARAGRARLAPGPRRRGPRPPRPRWPRRAAWGSTSTWRACRCARRTWSPSRSWSRSRRSGCSAWSSPPGWPSCSRCASAGRCARHAIGTVTDTRRLRVFDGDEQVGDMPVTALVDDAPLYDLEPEPPAQPLYPDPPPRLDRGRRPRATPCSPCSARRTWRPSASPSSSTTRSSGRAPCGGRRRPTPPCSMLAHDDGSGALAVSIDGNGRRVACDPYTGAVEAVLECARNLACVGAEPLGLTNCLNFGNPEKPHIAWQLTRAVDGLRDACLALGVPVVGGNVSLYNEGGRGADLPDAGRRHGRQAARSCRRARSRLRRGGPRARAGRPVRAGPRRVGAREAPRRTGGRSPARSISPAQADALVRLRLAVRQGRLATVHDISEGGLAVCARRVLHRRRSRRARGLGALSGEAELFGEGPGGVVIAGPATPWRPWTGRARDRRRRRRRAEIAGALSIPVSRAAGGLRGRDPGRPGRVGRPPPSGNDGRRWYAPSGGGSLRDYLRRPRFSA